MSANVLTKAQLRTPTAKELRLATAILPDIPGHDPAAALIISATRNSLARELELNEAAELFLDMLSPAQEKIVTEELNAVHRHFVGFNSLESIANRAVREQLMRFVNAGIPAQTE